MKKLFLVACLMWSARICSATIIDRIAIVVGKHPILASEIDREIRVTAFLNGERPDFSAASRKAAASRLIDQQAIRDQIRLGDYPLAPETEAKGLIEQIRKDRFSSDAQFQQALRQTGVTQAELKQRMLWQMTVLRFIDARFRPSIVVTDEEVHRYYDTHRTEFPEPLGQAQDKIFDLLTGERVNAALDDWLRQTREDMRIEYLDKTLQ